MAVAVCHPANVADYHRCSRTVLRSWEWAAVEEATEMEATLGTTITELSLAALRTPPDSK